MCDCKIVESSSRSEGPFRIVYCPLHAAAGELLGALRVMVDRWERHNLRGRDLITFDAAVAAIAKAEDREGPPRRCSTCGGIMGQECDGKLCEMTPDERIRWNHRR